MTEPTILEHMQSRAFAEFDELLDQRGRQFRAALVRDGRSEAEADRMAAKWLRAMSQFRGRIGDQVEAELERFGVPLDEPAKQVLQ